jgi:flagellar biosynthesis/type III secretory pathway protein FliH
VSDSPQVASLRSWVTKEAADDHDAFACGREFAVALLTEIDRLTAEREQLAEEVMAHQVGEGYERGYKHGQMAAAQHMLDLAQKLREG